MSLSNGELERLGFFYTRSNQGVWLSSVALDTKLGLRHSACLVYRAIDRELRLNPRGASAKELTKINNYNHLKAVLELTDWPALVQNLCPG